MAEEGIYAVSKVCGWNFNNKSSINDFTLTGAQQTEAV